MISIDVIEFDDPVPPDVRAALEKALRDDIRAQIDIVDTSIPTPAPREVR